MNHQQYLLIPFRTHPNTMMIKSIIVMRLIRWRQFEKVVLRDISHVGRYVFQKYNIVIHVDIL